MQETAIEWSEKSWNPVRGCTRVSEGCTRCYAERQAARYSGPGLPFEGFAVNTPAGPRWTGKVELIPEKLDEPLRMRKPARIFVNSMSDLFHESLTFEQIAAIFGIMGGCPGHTFQVLTKRPERAAAWFKWLDDAAEASLATFPEDNLAWRRARILIGSVIHLTGGSLAAGGGLKWPLPNVWLGVSAEDQATADARIPLLLQCPAAVRWVSAEPLLGPMDLSAFVEKAMPCAGCDRWVPLAGWTTMKTCGRCMEEKGVSATEAPSLERRVRPGLDWVVVGGESGPGSPRPMHPDWARSLRDQCEAAGVAYFFKQWGEAAPFDALAPDYQRQLRAPSILTDAEFVPATLYRVGKRAAGRLLDGREWSEMPAAKVVPAHG